MPPLNIILRPSSFPILSALILTVTGLPAAAESTTPVTVRSRQVELHYRLSGGEQADIELWFTRDRGMTWQLYGKDEDHRSPFVFAAPGEGLYGFTMIAKVGGQASRLNPQAYEPPQRWVFIDATPPLAQWNSVEPTDDFATSHTLQLRWTAHDDNLAARPIGLSYESSVEQVWHVIDDAVANTSVYDWKLPETIAGQITLKLIVRDEGGHVVERQFGPVALDKYAKAPTTAAANDAVVQAEPARGKVASTAPEAVAAAGTVDPLKLRTGGPGLLQDEPASTTQPTAQMHVDILKQRMAADLYRQASWHIVRSQYTVAAERLREALEQDPDLLEARQDLAGIFYRQQDYDRAITEYRSVLDRNPRYESALYGAALAYVAKRDYSQSRDMLSRLLTVNDRNAEAWLDLGDVLFMMGDTINARGHWRRAMKLDSAAPEVVSKAQRRLDLYGASDEVTSAAGKTGN